MKKFLLLALFMPLLILSSCSKDDDEPSLNGTKWTVTYMGTKYIVEFTSDKNVRSYEADANNNYVNYLHEGYYTLKDNQITFEQNKLFFTDVVLTSCDYYFFKKGTLSGNVINLTLSHKYIHINIKTGEVTEKDYSDTTTKLMKI